MQAGRGRRVILVAVFAALATVGTATMPRSDPVTATPEESETRAAAASRPARAPQKSRPTARACRPAPLPERAARVLVVGLPEVTDPRHPLVAEVVGLGVGGVLLTDDNVESRHQVAALAEGIRSRSRHPLVVSTDEETGRVRTFESILGPSPSARRLARESTPAAVRQRAREVGAALASMGIDLDLAPVADLDGGPWSGTIGDRSFSSDPAVASEYAQAFAGGLADGGVRATAKHFPGRGRATGDDHTGRVRSALTRAELAATHLEPFAALIDAGVPVVMTSHLEYAAFEPDLPASLSPAVYRLLRDAGFTGVAITDSVGMAAVNLRWNPAAAAVKAIAAGADAVLATNGSLAGDMVAALVAAVGRGELPEGRLDEAAARMTALAGGDPVALTCQAATVPELTTTAGAPG